MRHSKSKFLFILGLILTIGLTTVFANNGNDKKKKKRPKNTGILTVQTLEPRNVKVDGQFVGMSGTAEAAEFYLTPGKHIVEIEGPLGKKFTKEVNIVKNKKNCICIKFITKTTKRPCPYDMQVSGPNRMTEGDVAIFSAMNIAKVNPIDASRLNYNWRVTPDSAKITSGFGTNSISVDTTGLGGQTISVSLDVGDGVNDASCRQRISVDMLVEKLPPPPTIPPIWDEISTSNNDDDKARFDNLAIELQSNPNNQAYIIMYQGTDKLSQTRTAEKLTKMANDYLTKERKVDANRITFVRGGQRPRTAYVVYILKPGDITPTPN